MDMIDYAIALTESGLNVIPPHGHLAPDGISCKAPCLKWEKYQREPVTPELLKHTYSRGYTGIGIVCGKISGNLEVIDFDRADMFPQFMEWLEGYVGQALVDKITINGCVESTPNGIHLYFRCSTIGKNTKLAADANGKCLIETRAEGGYVVAAPSNDNVNPDGAYVFVHGDHLNIPTITPSERKDILAIASSFDEERFLKVRQYDGIPHTKKTAQNGDKRPGDDFNVRGDWRTLLESAGWQMLFRTGDTIHLRKPGSKSRTAHATLNHAGSDMFYNFSSSAHPFEPETSYTKFTVYTLLNHSGDFISAASQLATAGYGSKKTPPPVESVPWMQQKTKKTSVGINVEELMKLDLPPIRWIVKGLIPEGCIVLAGSPKIGKSWLATDMLLTISTPDRKLFGYFDTPEGTALYLALEDSLSRLQSRIQTICDGLLPYHPQAARPTSKAHICTDWPVIGKGCMERLEEFVTDHPDTRLVIVDTLQKVRPVTSGRGANAYEIDYAIVSQFQQFALKHHLALILITHLRKSNGMGDEDPFEQVTGSMGISGAADATIRLKRGTQSDIAELYIRGRDVEEQAFCLQNSNGTWYYVEEKEHGPAHYAEIVEFVKSTNKQEFTPAEFNRWHKENFGTDIKGIWVVLKRLYEAGKLTKMKEGKYKL